jgi:hypothetical protein
MVGLPDGGFGEVDFPAPIASVHAERRCPWVSLPDGIGQS